MINFFKIIVIFIPLGAVQGCGILPFPNTRVESYGVSSKVVDAETGVPIPHAMILAADPPVVAETDYMGRFTIRPVTRLHWGYLVGVISYPIWPFTEGAIDPDRRITISAPGYRTIRIEAGDGHQDRDVTSSSPEETSKLMNFVWLLPPIKWEKEGSMPPKDRRVPL